ncbi:MAG: DUF4468 domain-containing protein [Bacteroidia bacterium]|nr:DUF4468 domain-containing protein [Bacteroidia bacterium]
MKAIKIKYLITAIMLVLCFYANAQKDEFKEIALPVDQDTKLITYSKVIEITANKDSLFKKGQAWFRKFYKNPTGVIRETDTVNGKIVGKHQIKILNPADKKGIQTMKGITQYTINTYFKDNKIKIVLTEFNLNATSYTPIEKWQDKTAKDFSPQNYFYLEQIDKQMKDLLLDFEKFMKEPTKGKKDEW